ncbi:MAG: 5-(carboxyamino)imidazole ribonucleotide synthase [Sulfurovum sp.]|nr:5-(carboxyamino)imidazole ribonucleotide synthase [Sulfurovum sp.]
MIEKLSKATLKLGVIAGGQLGKMLIQEASKWGISTYVLDPDNSCPARDVSSVYIQGDYTDFDAVYEFGKQVDILTYEIENINIEALRQLKSEGIKIEPDPDVLALIQDKGYQKTFYEDKDIPTSAFSFYENTEQIHEAIDSGALQYPFVQKVRKGGYDGQGVALIHSVESSLLEGDSIVESLVDIDKEIAVTIARNADGDSRCFPAVEMRFNPQSNLVEDLFCPADISKDMTKKAESIAVQIIEGLDMIGLLAIEFFIDKAGNILVNEIAPRPHNSGHHTIESVVTSQLEQQLRAIFNLPLGSTKLKMPTVMLNLLGDPDAEGEVYYDGFEKALEIEGVKIHIYGKKIVRPHRKMGHITVLADSIEEALSKAKKAKSSIKVIACHKK